MGFIIRSAFWFSLVLLALPLDAGNGREGESVGPLQALDAARIAIGDLSGFCERQPDACATGRAAFETIGVRAREATRIAYELLDDEFGQPDETISTGTVEKADQ